MKEKKKEKKALKVVKEEKLPPEIPCVIGIDPGTDNLGWCVTYPNGKVMGWGLVTKTLDDLKKPEDLKAFHKNMRPFTKFLNELAGFSISNPDFIMERYMPRGMRRGNQVERINIVIGYLLAKINSNNTYMVPASSWKNHRERNYTYVDNDTIPEHIVDTYTMTLYYLEHIKGLISQKTVRKQLRWVREGNWGWKKQKGVWVHAG